MFSMNWSNWSGLVWHEMKLKKFCIRSSPKTRNWNTLICPTIKFRRCIRTCLMDCRNWRKCGFQGIQLLTKIINSQTRDNNIRQTFPLPDSYPFTFSTMLKNIVCIDERMRSTHSHFLSHIICDVISCFEIQISNSILNFGIFVSF